MKSTARRHGALNHPNHVILPFSLEIQILDFEDEILTDATTLAEAALKDGDVLVASLRAPAILGCRQCPAFFLVRGDGRVAVWGDVSLGVPRQLRNPQQVVGGRRALAALVDGRVITWGHGQFQPPAELLGQLEEVCQLCVTWRGFV